MSFNLDEFFDSIDVIVKQRLSESSYDTTIIATITDDSDKERGHYIVSDGTITFDAYVNDTNYKIGDQVRVSVINGDWSLKKFIIGLYAENASNEALTYIPPLGNVYSTNYSTNSVSINETNQFALYANGVETIKQVWGKQITQDSSEYVLQANGIYNVITLSGDFQTNLGPLAAGGYGLRLELYSKTDVNSNDRIMRFITFDSSEMIGNPYSFVIQSRQEKQFTIATDGIIDEIVLSIYQGVQFDDDGNSIANQFFDKDGNLISPIDDNKIWFKNISVGFGSNLSEITDNTLKFYTLDSTTYKYNISDNDNQTNRKRLGLVWYNKDVNDGYVGYSDGIYDPDYDEIEYLKFAHTDARLMRNAGKTTVADDELSLTLAANIEESEPYMTASYKALTTDLSTELQALGRQITGWNELKDKLNQLITSYVPDGETESVPAKLVQARNLAEPATQDWASLYYKYLQHGYNLQNEVYMTDQERDEALQKIIDWYVDSGYPYGDKTQKFNPYQLFEYAIHNAIDEVRNFFVYMEEKTRPDQSMSGYRSIYNNYNIRAEAVLKIIETNLSKIIISSTIGETTRTDFEWFNYYEAYVTPEDYPSYEKPEEEFEKYANRYCMYVYRHVDIPTLKYNEDEDLDSDNNIEYTFGRFLGANWERIKHNPITQEEVINPFIPDAGETIDDIQYNAPSSSNELLLTLDMEPTKDVEKFQVVFFYNHEKILSNTLVFTNLEADQIPPQFKVDANDIIRINHGAYSQDHYQAYSQANDLVNIADESRRRMVSCTYEGALSGDETLAGAQIYWYIPVNSTMLTYDRRYLVEDLEFFCDDESKTDYSKEGYIYFNKTIDYDSEEISTTDVDGNILYDALGNPIKETKITIKPEDKTFSYKIKPYYEQSAQNNTILVEAHITNDKNEVSVIKGELPLTFSSYGTNGTNYTLSIVPNTTQIAALPVNGTDEEGQVTANPLLQLKVTLRNGDGELIALNEEAFTFPNTSSSEQLEDTNEEITTNNFKIGWHAVNGNGTTVSIFGNTEDNKEQLLEISPVYSDNTPYVGIIKASVEYPEELSDGAKRTLRLSTVYPIPYSSASGEYGADYYISGPTMIIYDNQGVVSRCSDEPYKLFQHTIDGDVEIPCYWDIQYFEDDGTYIEDPEDRNIIDYMPKLDYRKNTLLPAPMYCDFADGSFIVPVIVAAKNSDITDILWTQPIVITQNTYASSTLNEWNGEFKIDEANGTILSTMVGAGRKNLDNQFEGILMGDIERGANFDANNASGLGLYGFNQGAQSFYFGIDGTAFLGKSGRGRICFDGNEGTIASASYMQNREQNLDGTYKDYKQPVTNDDGDIVGYNIYNSAGMMIDLDDGFIDMKGSSMTDYENGSYVPSAPVLTEGEWDSLPTEDELKKQYDGYSDYYDASSNLYIKSYKQSKIHIDVKSPYFTIHSANQPIKDKHLMFIGDDEYYLQTDDYEKTEFEIADKTQSTPGKGFKLNLKDSLIDASNFRLTSKNILIDSSGTDKDAMAFFIIKNDAGRNLMYVDNSKYYLQSADFASKGDTTYPLGKGMKITLAGGSPNGIEAYNFSLRSGDTGGGDHRIILQDVSPYFIVNTGVTSNGTTVSKSLAVIGDDEFYFQSADYQKEISNSDDVATTKGKGMRLSVSGHEIEAYEGFTLRAYQKNSNGNDTSNYILLDANASSYPLRITDKFKVSWAGDITADGGTFTNIDVQSGKISGDLTVNGTLDGGKITGAEIYGSIIANDENVANATFYVNKEGHLVAASATIGGWNVSDGSGGGSAGFTYPNVGSMTNLGLEFGDNFFVDPDGILTANGAKLQSLEVYKSMVVSASAASTLSIVSPEVSIYDPGAGSSISALVSINGNTSISGSTVIDGTLTLGSNIIYLTSSGSGGAYIYASDTSTFGIYKTKTLTLNGETISIGSSQNTTIYLGSSTGSGSITYARGPFHYIGDIYCDDGEENKGVNGTITYVSGGFWGGTKKTAKFVKGILVSADDIDEGATETGNYSLPTISSAVAGYTLQVNSSGTDVLWHNSAPSSHGSDGYVWMGNGTTVAPSWKSLTGFTTDATNRKYKINKDSSDNFYVNVPWTDTTYSAGTGISISDGTISCTVSEGVSASYMSSYGTARYVNAQSNSGTTYIAVIQNTGTTSVRYSGTTISSLSSSSSRRFKNTITEDFDSSILYQLKPVSYYYNEDMYFGTDKRYGFIAEDVYQIAPELVEKDSKDSSLCNAIYYNSIISLAVAEIQKLRKELDELKSNL